MKPYKLEDTVTDPMLEEVWVQVLVKAIFKLDFRYMELHLK